MARFIPRTYGEVSPPMWPGNETRGYGRRVNEAIILDQTNSMNIYLKLEINMAE